MRLKGTEKSRRQSTQNNTPSQQSASGATGEDMAIASSIMALTEDMEKVQKEMARNAADQQRQISTIKEKNNNIQTQFENEKQSTAASQKKAVAQAEIKAEALNTLQAVENTVSEKMQDLHCNKLLIQNKDTEIAELNTQKQAKQAAIEEVQRQIAEQRQETKQARS